MASLLFAGLVALAGALFAELLLKFTRLRRRSTDDSTIFSRHQDSPLKSSVLKSAHVPPLIDN